MKLFCSNKRKKSKLPDDERRVSRRKKFCWELWDYLIYNIHTVLIVVIFEQSQATKKTNFRRNFSHRHIKTSNIRAYKFSVFCIFGKIAFRVFSKSTSDEHLILVVFNSVQVPSSSSRQHYHAVYIEGLAKLRRRVGQNRWRKLGETQSIGMWIEKVSKANQSQAADISAVKI